jgi:ferredoxin
VTRVRIEVDKDRCIGAGRCVLLVPDVFDCDDDGLVTLLRQPGPQHLDDVHEVRGLCPASAITLLPTSPPTGEEPQ